MTQNYYLLYLFGNCQEKIIYDVHENYYKQFSARKNFNKVFKKIILTTIRFIEFFFSLFVDKIVFVIEKLSDSLEEKVKLW